MWAPLPQLKKESRIPEGLEPAPLALSSQILHGNTLPQSHLTLGRGRAKAPGQDRAWG